MRAATKAALFFSLIAVVFLIVWWNRGAGRSTPTAERGQLRAEATLPASLVVYCDDAGQIPLELVLIPAGEFMMGSPDTEIGREGNEGPQHKVAISKPFYLGKYEVTQTQWQAVMGSNPSWFSPSGSGKSEVVGLDTSQHPVENVSWVDCQRFCRKLSARVARQAITVRLPSDAEWEYACRAGSARRFSFGDSDEPLGEHAWFKSNSDFKTHPVRTKKPNAWGLYDMHGNVWEWCADWYGADYYVGRPNPDVDPQGTSGGAARVVRGGSWYSGSNVCRCASRSGCRPDIRLNFNGVRVAAGTE